MKKSHLKIQKVGELEDKRAVDLARTSSEGRHMMKQFSNRHKDELQKGEDPRSNSHIVDMKKKHLMDKMKNNSTRSSGRGDKSVSGSRYGDKQKAKMMGRSRPTRSKLILKRDKFDGGSSKGGRGGRGDSVARGVRDSV